MTKDALKETLRTVPLDRRLAVALAAARLRYQDIADRSGLSDSHFSYIVRGRRTANPEQRKAIAKAIGVSVADLFGEVVKESEVA